MLQFDEIIPFERQTTAKIFSPRLLNMMLVCGPQIEGTVELISECFNFKTSRKDIPELIRKINFEGVLSNFEIVTASHNILFTPFPKNLEWWKTYNDLKHELAEKQSEITYTVVMDALAALAALHRLANAIKGTSTENLEHILDKQYWDKTFEVLIGSQTGSAIGIPPPWKSKTFKISNYFVYNPNC